MITQSFDIFYESINEDKNENLFLSMNQCNIAMFVSLDIYLNVLCSFIDCRFSGNSNRSLHALVIPSKFYFNRFKLFFEFLLILHRAFLVIVRSIQGKLTR